MNYGNTVEEKVYKKYISHGINENVKIINVEKITGDKEGTVWNAFDVTFSNGESELKARFFEFKYREGGTDAKGTVLDEKTQEMNYLKRVKHLFSKALGDPKLYDSQISKVTGFDSFISTLKSMVVTPKEDIISKPFRLLCIDNKKGYAKVPDWDSGFTESMDINPSKLKFDEVKYGKKTKPENVEKIEPSSENSLPF